MSSRQIVSQSAPRKPSRARGLAPQNPECAGAPSLRAEPDKKQNSKRKLKKSFNDDIGDELAAKAMSKSRKENKMDLQKLTRLSLGLSKMRSRCPGTIGNA